MIDKAELRVTRSTGFSREFQGLYEELRNDPKGPFRSSKHYLAVADLRPYGHPAILHTYCIRDKQGNHKLELIDTGERRYSEMSAAIERIFAVDPRSLSLMRLDLTADVPGVSVEWFERHVIGTWKRRTCSIGKFDNADEFIEMGSRGIETFYLGRRPNCIRIYNKIAELKQQYALMKRRTLRVDRASLPSFEDVYGYPMNGYTLTRVERQFGGARLPAKIKTFRQLRQAGEFNPFEQLRFTAKGIAEPNPDDYEFETYCTGMFLRQRAERLGMHRLKQWINQHSTRNGNRVLEKYADFLPAAGEGITPERLLERYRESVTRQLAA